MLWWREKKKKNAKFCILPSLTELIERSASVLAKELKTHFV
jgi:hypothetical protein